MIQHADDSTYPLRDIKSVKNEVKLIHKFSNVARHKLNINNTRPYKKELCNVIENTKHK